MDEFQGSEVIAVDARAIVLVEGISDRIAVERWLRATAGISTARVFPSCRLGVCRR